MASTTAICTSFKQELLEGSVHDFQVAGDAFYWALYTSAATNGAGTTAYSATSETSGTAYVARGETVANIAPTTGSGVAYVTWTDPTWSAASFTAASVLLFNSTDVGDAAVAVWDFSGDQTASGGDFVLAMPTADSTNAILRLA